MNATGWRKWCARRDRRLLVAVGLVGLAFLAGAVTAQEGARPTPAAEPAAATAQEEIRPAPAAEPAAAPALRVAVVDMTRILGESAEWRDLAAERTRLLENMKRTLDKLSRQAQILRNQCENLPPETEERRRKTAEFEKTRENLNRSRQEFERQISEQHNQAVRSLFGKICAAIKAHAEKNGLDLVLKKQNLELTGPETIEQSLLMATTEVLYSNPAMDISDAVVERLNADYKGPIEVP